MVMVPKANGKVRIYVDLTQLYRSVKREMHILPSVEDIYVCSSEEWESFQQSWRKFRVLRGSPIKGVSTLNYVYNTVW